MLMARPKPAATILYTNRRVLTGSTLGSLSVIVIMMTVHVLRIFHKTSGLVMLGLSLSLSLSLFLLLLLLLLLYIISRRLKKPIRPAYLLVLLILIELLRLI